jgi:hypothetical protein
MPRGTLKSSLLLVGTLGMVEVPEEAALRPAALSFHPAPPTQGIAAVIQLWATAWLDGNTEAMFACLHPGLAKHILGLETLSSSEALQHLIGVQSLLGKAVRDRVSEADVWVLDVHGRPSSISPPTMAVGRSRTCFGSGEAWGDDLRRPGTNRPLSACSG